MKVTAIKAFRGIEGYVPRGTEIDVTDLRAAELRRVGLVADGDAKAAQPTPNKKAAEPQNKARAK